MLGHATSRCVLFRLDPEMMRSGGNVGDHAGSAPDPYLRAVEGDVRGQEFWDTTSGLDVMKQVAAGDFVPPCWLLMGLPAVDTAERSRAWPTPLSSLPPAARSQRERPSTPWTSRSTSFAPCSPMVSSPRTRGSFTAVERLRWSTVRFVTGRASWQPQPRARF